MTARIINGRHHAAVLKDRLEQTIKNQNLKPGLAVILIGKNPASEIYVTKKKEACEAIGIKSEIHRLNEDCTNDIALSLINNLNNNPDIHGILLQLPLPPQLSASLLTNAIKAEKDVDGLHPVNLGHLMNATPTFVPCTPQGVLHLLKEENILLSGEHAVIIGRSVLFGKPMGQLLLQENATVTQCHSRTNDLQGLVRQADIVICATGQAHMIKGDWIKPGATVIDVGITRLPDGSLAGDVELETVNQVAGAITPVPGGVGPMTIACLLSNTVKAASNKRNN